MRNLIFKTNTLLWMIVGLSGSSANAFSLFVGSGIDSLPLARVGLANENFKGTPLNLGLSFETDGNSKFSFFTTLQVESCSRTGSASDQMKGTTFQFGGGMKYSLFFLQAGVHFGSQTLTEASGSVLNFSDRSSHIGGGIDYRFMKSFSLKLEEQASFVSLFGTGDSTFSPVYSGQYFRTLAYLVYHFGQK